MKTPDFCDTILVMKKTQNLEISFLISLIVHGFLFFLIPQYLNIHQSDLEDKTSKTSSLQFVTDPERWEVKNEELDQVEEKKFLSKRKKRVKKNAQSQPSLSEGKLWKRARRAPSSGGDQAFERAPREFSEGRSLSDYMKDIPIGQMTVLNTDPFAYYTFFVRANSKIKPLWIHNIQNIPMEFFENSRRERYTVAKLVITPKGRFVRVILEKSSGIPVIDQAATSALKGSAPLPNPPQDLMGEDQFIHLTYSFHIIWK